MKQRLVSSIVGVILLAMILNLYDTLVLTIALALLSGAAVYEILIPTKFLYVREGGMFCAFYAGISLIFVRENISIYHISLVIFWCMLIACKLIFHQKFSFIQMCICLFTVTFISYSFGTVLMLGTGREGWIYLLLACIGAWVTDSAAYIIGKLYGKRKITSYISPNKTLEGVIGGLVVAAIIFPMVCYSYWRTVMPGIHFIFRNAFIVGVICACAGILGDLFASAIKREAGIKDFGNLIPGHGGIMDRFDSFLFTAPVLYYLLEILPIYE